MGKIRLEVKNMEASPTQLKRITTAKDGDSHLIKIRDNAGVNITAIDNAMPLPFISRETEVIKQAAEALGTTPAAIRARLRDGEIIQY